ncbi:hypothetical protein BDV93DRAFT_562053, partial [Ceratobasidium sp. AG-I]
FDGGYLTDNQIHEQVEVLNTHFQSAGISFKLENIDYTQSTQNRDWFIWTSENDFNGIQMRQALHLGGYDDLNIYSVLVAVITQVG